MLVAVPADGGYGDKITVGSGYMTAERTQRAFARYAKDVRLADANLRERDALLDAARRQGAGYLAIPTIMVWEQASPTTQARANGTSIVTGLLRFARNDGVDGPLLRHRCAKVGASRTNLHGSHP